MNKITELELYQAKEKCMELSNNQQRFVLKGTLPILFTSSLFTEDNMSQGTLNRVLDYDGFACENYVSHSYTDALTYLFHEKLGVSGMVSYLPLSEHIIDNKKQLITGNLYFDQEIKDMLKKENIQAVINTKIGTLVDRDLLSFTEFTSSFAFAGCSGFSIKLEDQLDQKGIHNHNGFHIYPNAEAFRSLGYDFTEDTILYNRLVGLKKVAKNHKNDPQLWPRTMEVGFSDSMDDMDLFLKGSSELLEYVQFVAAEIENKGMYDALEPMKPKQKIK